MAQPQISIDLASALDALDKKLASFRTAKTENRINCHSLLEEIKHNKRVCHMYLEYGVDLIQISRRFSREIYNELGMSGADLKKIKNKKIIKSKSLDNSLVSSWQRKPTVKLIRNAYDKITEIVEFYPIAPPGKINPKLRMRYLDEKLDLLIRTIDCDK